MERKIVLQRLADELGAHTYLEIGVHKGHTFFAINAPRKIAVDPAFDPYWHRKPKASHEYSYELTSDAFFTWYGGTLFRENKIDVAFIDGKHTFEQSLRDIQHCLANLSKKGVIMVHDCLPPHRAAASIGQNKRAARLNHLKKYKKGWTGEWTGDVWKSMVFLRVFHPELEVFVLNCDYGLGLVFPKNIHPSSITAAYEVDQIRKMSFDFLQANKTKLLNLKPPGYFNNWLRERYKKQAQVI